MRHRRNKRKRERIRMLTKIAKEKSLDRPSGIELPRLLFLWRGTLCGRKLSKLFIRFYLSSYIFIMNVYNNIAFLYSHISI